MSDPVTGLLSHDGFLSAVRTSFAAAGGGVLVLVEMEGMRDVNAALGHAASQQLLRLLSDRLRQHSPAGSRLGRMASSELAVAAPGAADAGTLASSLAERLSEPVELYGVAVRPAVRTGAFRCGPADDAEEGLSRAALALVAAHDAALRSETFDEGRHLALQERRRLVLDLAGAALREELALHYQPVIDLRDNRLVGAEALMRWHRSGDLLMPGAFIEQAEASGAIVEMGRWALGEACRQVAHWNERYRSSRPPLEIGVNLSVRQLGTSHLAKELALIVEETDVDPGVVNLEVTESAIMEDFDEVVRRLEELRAIGVTISMDDFGTGYSSLSALRRLPVNTLKIDRSFVTGIANHDEEWALAVAIVRLAASLGKRTLAEGIETPAQMAHLRALHCDLGQGYLFGRPLIPEQFEALLSAPDPPGQGSKR